MVGDCVCGKDFGHGAHPTPCHNCRAKAGLCECCGAEAPGGKDNFYPYGTYCAACGDEITDPVGCGHCLVKDGREHRSAPDESTPPCFGGTLI